MIIAGLAVTAHAQAPGYLGRKYMLRYDWFFMPGLATQSPRTYQHRPGFYVNQTQLISAERVISRRSVIGLGVSYTRLGNPRDGYITFTQEQLWSRIVTKGIVFTSKMYPFQNKGWIAPLGPFFRIDLSFISTKAASFTDLQPNVAKYERSHQGLSFALGGGYSHLFWERIFLEYGFRVSFSDFPTSLNISPNTREERDANALLNTDVVKFFLGTGLLFGKTSR